MIDEAIDESDAEIDNGVEQLENLTEVSWSGSP